MCFFSQQVEANEIRDALFKDPTNIDLNLAYLQQQLAGQNFKGAAATLQRVLLLDPSSRFAKILYADVQIKLGNWSDAKRILAELLADPALPPDMRSKANKLTETLESAERRWRLKASLNVAGGGAENALALSRKVEAHVNGEASISDNSDPDVDVAESFIDTDFSMGLDYKLASYTPRVVSVNFGMLDRAYNDRQDIDSTTAFLSMNLASEGESQWGLAASSYHTEIDGAQYSVGQQAVLSFTHTASQTLQLALSAIIGGTRHFVYQSSAAAKDRDNTKSGLQAKTSRAFPSARLPFSASLSLARSHISADEAQHSSTVHSLSANASSKLGGFYVTLSAGYAATEFDAPTQFGSFRPFGDKIRQDERSSANLSVSFETPRRFGGVLISASGFVSDTRSNIRNYTKSISEAKIGIRKSF